LPGGKREDSEPVRLAAIREFAEETGLVVMLEEGEPIMLPPSARHRGALLFRGRAEGQPKAGSDADQALWWTAAEVLRSEELSDLATRDVLRAWAREYARGDQ
jgi:8-oxo-dGTP pyrophosphatase MutT (NUDIX family)